MQFIRFLYQRGLGDRIVNAVLKTIKSIYNYLKKEKGWNIPDFYKHFHAPQIDISPVVLLPEQVSQMIHNKENIPLNSIQQKVLDIVVFGCTCGLRISDLCSLKKNSILKTGDDFYLKFYTHKTGQIVQIPLPAYCKAIVQKYQKLKGAMLLPHLAIATINRQFKELGKLFGFSWILPKFRSVEGKAVEIKHADGSSWKFYEHLTAHTMRRTAITTLLMMGVDEAVVRTVSGHTAGSREFYRYVALAQSYLNKEVRSAYEKIATDPECYRK